MQPNEHPQKPEDITPSPIAADRSGIPSVKRVLQPLSSEADILASAALARTAPAEPTTQSDSTGGAFPHSPSPSIETAAQSYTEDSDSRLITEPIGKPQQLQSYPQSTVRVSEGPQKKSHKVRNAILITLLIIVVGGCYIYLSAGRVTTADLVENDVDNTTYLRPKQWQKLDNGTSNGYGNKLGGNGKSSALMLVSRSSTKTTALANMPDSMLDITRQSILSTLTDTSLEAAFKKGDNGCNTVGNIQKEPDTRSVGSTIGIYKLTADCIRDDGTFNINVRGMLGKDGYFRTAGIIAEKSNWERNKDAYQRMLDSVQQKDGSV